MTSGEVHQGRTDFPHGDPENPADDEMLMAKFRRLASHSWAEPEVKALLAGVLSLEKLEDVAELLQRA